MPVKFPLLFSFVTRFRGVYPCEPIPRCEPIRCCLRPKYRLCVVYALWTDSAFLM